LKDGPHAQREMIPADVAPPARIQGTTLRIGGPDLRGDHDLLLKMSDGPHAKRARPEQRAARPIGARTPIACGEGRLAKLEIQGYRILRRAGEGTRICVTTPLRDC
jgi:hypothetical protein